MLQDHLKPLTSLRFFAALWVVLFTYIHELDSGIHIGFIDKGYLGVEGFFILSGFILSYVYLEGFGTRRFDYFTFINHRLARIYPLHIATLLVTLVLAGMAAVKGVTLGDNVVNWAALPAHLTLTQAWGLAPSASFNHPSWSISAEWLAYLGFPVVATAAWALRHRPILAVALACLILTALYIVFYVIAGFPLTEATFQWGALRIVPCFLLGSALYLAWRAGAVARPWIATTGAAVAGLTVIIASSFARSDIVIVIALGLLILSSAGLGRDGEGRETGILSSPLCVYLGEISFAVYMIYVPWKWVWLKGVNALLGTDHAPLPFFWWLAGLLALIPLAMLAHHLVERPFRRILRNWGDVLRYKYTYQLAKHG